MSVVAELCFNQEPDIVRRLACECYRTTAEYAVALMAQWPEVEAALVARRWLPESIEKFKSECETLKAQHDRTIKAAE